MKMKTLCKALLVTLCALLLVVGSVFGTLAYLTSNDSVTNTFTVGKVVITLDEAKVDEYGVPVSPAERVKTNEYKLIPGKTYTKDPIIHVDADSESCWLFVKIENGLDGVEDSTDTILSQMTNLGWTLVSTENNVYCYDRIAIADEDIPVFAHFVISGDADEVSLAAAGNVVVTAYAVQADGFATAAEAWTATFGAPVNP